MSEKLRVNMFKIITNNIYPLPIPTYIVLNSMVAHWRSKHSCFNNT